MKFNSLVYSLLMILVWGSTVQNAFAGDNLSVIAVGDIMMGSTGERGLLPPRTVSIYLKT